MTRVAPVAIFVLATACGSGENVGGAGGAGGTGGAAGSAGGGGSGTTGCVDIVITGPGEADVWFEFVDPLPGWLATAQDKILVAWLAYRWTPEGVPGFTKNQTVPWLMLEQFDKETGARVARSEISVLPDGVKYGEGGYNSFSARPDGRFVVGYSYPAAGILGQHVAIGSVGEPITTKLELPTSGDPAQIGLQTHAAWDGEAFAMHAYGSPPKFTLHVARVDDVGNVLLPFTQYGQTPNVHYILHGHATATSAESGHSYVFDAALSTRLNAHDRTGNALGGTPKQLTAGNATQGATEPALGVDGEGAWVGWNQESATVAGEMVLQRVSTSATPVGSPVIIKGGNYEDMQDPGNVWEWTLYSHQSSAVTVVVATRSAIYLRDVVDGVPKPGRVVVNAMGAPQMDARNIEVLRIGDDLWVGFSEQHQGFRPNLRIVNAKPGCVYPASLGTAEPSP